MIGGTEVVAVYVEDRIRTYGFELRTGLSLVTLAAADVSVPATTCPEAGEVGVSLLMAIAQTDRDGATTLRMLLATEAPPGPEAWARAGWTSGEGSILECLHPIDAVWFHGPHFGDRHGIAAAALGALRRGAVPLLCASFAGASVFLVLPPGQGEPALAWLRAHFAVPTSGSETP